MTVAAREYTRTPSEIDPILADLVEQFLQRLQAGESLESSASSASSRETPMRARVGRARLRPSRFWLPQTTVVPKTSCWSPGFRRYSRFRRNPIIRTG
jgi:hypothetical protein